MTGRPPAPTLPDSADMQAIEGELEGIVLAVADAQVALAGGGVIDLAGLDDRIAAICAALETRPPEAARALLPRLLALVEDLNGLSAACDKVRADTSIELERVATRNRASLAYGRKPEPPPPLGGPTGE
ncbi:hypothetical protein IGS68_22780 [Skermanella sp. TT6]|uniref:Flagellar protein FliT n=1 Tax=Skermanella cutis TaxID=2775420 RepID=A0ABX7B3B0_9PROT|nr:hypothetical protein [Skermanella sp. TT6]QQP88809.1 hypothetical protein IGS68_22780 [Skermanella sp. TT6]